MLCCLLAGKLSFYLVRNQPILNKVFDLKRPQSSRSIELNCAFSLSRHAINRPNQIALVVDGDSYSYAELALFAGKVAAWLQAAEPEKMLGARVGVLTSRTLDTYAGILGACWSGASYVPINSKLPAARLANVLARGKLGALIVDETGVKCLEQLESDLIPQRILGPITKGRKKGGNGGLMLQGLNPVPEPVAVSADHCAYVMFTSGTTGLPKGVMVSTGNLWCYLDCLRRLYRLGPEDRVSQFSEVSFDFSVLDLFFAWDAGATLYTVPDSQLMAPARFIQENKLTFWASVPSVISFLDRFKLLKPGAFPSLRASYFCGEPLALASAQAWQQAAPNSVVDNHYGPTEATVACSFDRLSAEPNVTPERGIVAIGKPYSGMRMAVVDEAGSFLPAGETGELALSGSQVALGYLGEPELTARRFRMLKHPQWGLATWYLTGDLAREDHSGCFHHLGRVDHQVKVLGHRIELEEVDSHLRNACGCDAAVAVAWPVRQGIAEGLVAFVGGGTLDSSHILENLKQRVPPYMVPQRIIRMASLPLTPNGKIDRRRLAESLDQDGTGL
jgi:amino acid adenylation domain-containing protein